jgi:hypothetical protein
LVLAGATAGINQATNRNPAWGQGGKAFAKRFGAAYADQAISNYMTDAILPSILHQDPRYYRLGEGSFSRRTRYALTRILRTRTDSGAMAWNYSEVGGTVIAAGIGAAYYPEQQRNAGNVFGRFGLQIATDAGFNLLKEFWPEISNKFLKRRPAVAPSASKTGM